MIPSIMFAPLEREREGAGVSTLLEVLTAQSSLSHIKDRIELLSSKYPKARYEIVRVTVDYDESSSLPEDSYTVVAEYDFPVWVKTEKSYTHVPEVLSMPYGESFISESNVYPGNLNEMLALQGLLRLRHGRTWIARVTPLGQ